MIKYTAIKSLSESEINSIIRTCTEGLLLEFQIPSGDNKFAWALGQLESKNNKDTISLWVSNELTKIDTIEQDQIQLILRSKFNELLKGFSFF